MNDRRLIPVEAEFFYLLAPTHPSTKWVPAALRAFHHFTVAEFGSGHSPVSSDEVKNARGVTSASPYVFMTWCLNTGTTFPRHLNLSFGLTPDQLYIAHSLEKAPSMNEETYFAETF